MKNNWKKVKKFPIKKKSLSALFDYFFFAGLAAFLTDLAAGFAAFLQHPHGMVGVYYEIKDLLFAIGDKYPDGNHNRDEDSEIYGPKREFDKDIYGTPCTHEEEESSPDFCDDEFSLRRKLAGLDYLYFLLEK